MITAPKYDPQDRENDAILWRSFRRFFDGGDRKSALEMLHSLSNASLRDVGETMLGVRLNGAPLLPHKESGV